jgi:hypothetical protein
MRRHPVRRRNQEAGARRLAPSIIGNFGEIDMVGKCTDRVGLYAVAMLLATAWTGAAAEQAGGQPGSVGNESTRALDFGLTIGAIHSDNIARQPVNADEGTIGSAGLVLGYFKERRRLLADIDVNAQYQRYMDDEFEEELVGGLNGTVIVGLVPGRFEWVTRDNFGQLRRSPFAADTPENRENFNYFTTGPDVTMLLPGNAAVRVSGRYSTVEYEISSQDARRLGGTVAWIRGLGSPRSLSLQAGTERVDFDDVNFAGGYDRHFAFVRYEARGARTQLSADAGFGMVAEAGETDDGVLLQLDLRRQLSPASTLNVRAGTRFSDAGDLFRYTQESGGVTLDSIPAPAASDVFENRFLALNWDFSRNRTGFGVRVEGADEAYDKAPGLDRKRFGYHAYFSRQLTPVTGMRLFAGHVNEEFDVSGFELDDLRLGADLNRRMGRAFQWRLQYEYIDRDATSALNTYRENRVSLFLIWRPL